MTNSSQTEQSTAFLQKVSYLLVAVSVVLASFVGVQLITEMNVAHGQSIANPSELNAEFFAENSSNDLAQANTQDLSNGDEFSQSRGLLAQAGNNNNCDYLTDNLRIDMNNDSQQVYKLQAFLQAYAYDYVDLTGTFDEATLRAVRAFQTRHADEILEPWGYEADESTGYVYITTRQKINELYCDQDLDLTADQQSEIASYRQQLNRWRAQGAEFDTPQYLAQYRTQQQNTLAQQTQNNNNTQTQINGGDEMAAADDDTSEPADDMNDMDNEGESQTEDIDEATGTATNTDTGQDSDGFFSQLFGQGEEVDQADGQGTTTDGNDDGTTTQQSTDEDVGTAGTSGVDQAATSVYSGVNSVVGFIFSPTFLLILLGVLILLLIATLLEDDDGDAYAEITADDFAKDFDGESNNDDSELASKTQSADFDDTPAGDSSDQSDNNATSNQEDSSSSEGGKDSKSS